jgi:hypothetical protein
VTFRWSPPFSFAGVLRQHSLKAHFDDLLDISLSWRRAEKADWPKGRLNSDHRFARKGGFGWVASTDQEILFLVPRGWLEPEWGLSSFGNSQWQHLGNFEPLPKNWSVPALVGEGFL